MEEDELFKIINYLNPHPGIAYKEEEYFIKQPRGGKYRLFSWFTKTGEDIFVSSMNFPKQLQKYSKIPITSQIYYDIIILGITNQMNRPKCPICKNILNFDCLSHGYPVTCSKNCHKVWKKDHMNSKMTKKGDIVPENVRRKIGDTIKSKNKEEIWSDEWKRKHSEHMKAFAKTEEGKLFYKKVGEKVSIANIKNLINTGKDNYFSNKNFHRGRYESKKLGKIYNYDSGWELEFIKYFERDSTKGVKIFDRCKDYVIYKWDDGSIHRYLPDFFILLDSGVRIIVEIKPAYLLKSSRKVQLSTKAGKEYFQNKGIKYLIITEKELLSNNHLKFDFNLLSLII